MIVVNDKSKMEAQLKSIADITRKKYHELESIGVLGGQSGVALFHFYCAKYFDEDSYADIGVEIISSCFEKINNGYSYPTYCNGMAGFGWVLEHLATNEFIELDLNELLLPFDEYLLSQMQFDLENGNYDFLHGALGYGFYFLKRFNSSQATLKTKEKYRSYLSQLLESLEQMAIKDDDGLKWESVLDIDKGNTGFNLSLSHGMSSIVYFLFKLFSTGIERNRTLILIKGAINFFKKHEKQNQEGFSLFSNYVEPNKANIYESRLAWCYGDIGIGKAFGWAAVVLEDKNLEKKATEILLHSSTRRNPSNTSVVDAGYCHGSFGNAHLFYKTKSCDNKELFKKAAEFWFNDGISRNTGNQSKPYLVQDSFNHVKRLEINLLEGVSGIGLVMIDFLSEKEHSWSECLMLV